MEETLITLAVLLASFLGWITGQIINHKAAIARLQEANLAYVANQKKIDKSIETLTANMGVFEGKIMDRLTEMQKEIHNFMMRKK